jgi:hypothetical protein
MNHFLVYWKPSTVVENEIRTHLMHSASDQYDRVGVRDCLWIVTSEGADDLVLVARQQVDRIVGQLEAERLTSIPNLWKSEYHAISDSPEEKAYLDISQWAHQLTFEGVVEELPPDFTGKNLQKMRRLDGASADLLERLWQRRLEAE